MIRTVTTRLLLAAALVVTIPTAAIAQEAAGPEGTQWYLTAYDAGGSELTEVPWDVVATLSLAETGASGYTGCNQYEADYERNGDAMSLRETGMDTANCPGRLAPIQQAYLAALPKVARWSLTPAEPTRDRELVLFDADDEQLLRLSPSRDALLARQVEELTAQLEAQQQVIKKLRARIKELEPGG